MTRHADVPVVIPADADLLPNGDSPQDTPIDFSEFEEALRGPTVHFFPYDRTLQVGDRALCGAVKTGTSAWGQKFNGAPLSCAECTRLRTA